eukprot:TRINITY_DN4574_c0_g1_i13.p1 TRINITY_DN4574_c0_g1~~TRINITY_DN4574_c0_g1_i13.p1  ORF type:complete len:218 (+),score=7.92 TRINITY_DN4574_c0_g1_i13:566-1219(+)
MSSGVSGKITGIERAISVQVDGVLLEQVERDDLQGSLIGRIQRDFRRLAGTIRLNPAGGAKAPALASLEAWKIEFRARRRQVVAGCLGICEEFFGKHDTDGVTAKIVFRGVAAPITEKAGYRLVTTGQQRPTQDIELIATPREITRFHGSSGDFVDPGLLDGFKDLFAAMLGIVVETGQGHHPVAQIDKINFQRILVRMSIAQFDGDIVDVSPFHLR